MKSRMEEAAASCSTGDQPHTPGELQLLRLVICGMRAAARAAAAAAGTGASRARSLEAAACRVIARQAQKNEAFVHALWCGLRAASLCKLRAHLARGDAVATRQRDADGTPTEPLTGLDWAVVDLLLLYDTPLLSVASFHQRAQLEALERTFQLVQKLRLEPVGRREVRPDKWIRAARGYSCNGMQMSAVALQRRWHELKLDTRRRACGPSAAGPRPLLLPIHRRVATRYPHVVNASELPTWHKLVADGQVADPTDERGPAPGETLESQTVSTTCSVETINVSDDEDTAHNEQQSGSCSTLIALLEAGPMHGNNKSTCDGTNITQNINHKENDITVTQDIIEIHDDTPSPETGVVEAMQYIDNSIDANVVYDSEEVEDVKMVSDVETGDVDEDKESSTVINNNVENCDTDSGSDEIIKVDESDYDDNITIANSEDIFQNIADMKIDIEEHSLEKIDSMEIDDSKASCSSPDLNIQIENIQQKLGVKNDENVINSKIVNSSICKKLENLSTDQLIDEILSKCEIKTEYNHDNIILKLALSKDRNQNTAKRDNSDITSGVNAKGTSERKKINAKDVDCHINVKKGNNDKKSKKMPSNHIEASVIKSKVGTPFNENYIDPKLLMCPVILLRRIDETIRLKKSLSLKHKMRTEYDEGVNRERLKTKTVESTSSKHRKTSSIQPSYTRIFYETNKALLRKLKPCRVYLRRLDEEWKEGDVGGERRRRVRLPDMEKVRRNQRGVFTAEVAPIRNTTKRARPNTPENHSAIPLPSISSFSLEPVDNSSTCPPPLFSSAPLPWQARLPEPSVSDSDSYQNLPINPSNQQNSLVIAPPLNQHYPIDSLIRNALKVHRPLLNPNVPSQSFVRNAKQRQQNIQNWLDGMQPNITHMHARDTLTQNMFSEACHPLRDTSSVAESTPNVLPQYIPTNQNITIQNLNIHNVITPTPKVGAVETQNVSCNILSQNTSQNIPSSQNMQIQNLPAHSIRAQNIPPNRCPPAPYPYIPNQNIPPNLRPPPPPYPNQNMQIQNLPVQNIITQNISTENLSWPHRTCHIDIPGIQIQTGITNTNQPTLTIDGSLIAQSLQRVVLNELLQKQTTTLQDGQIMNPVLTPRPTNPQVILDNINNQVFLSNSLPTQMLRPPPLIDISTISTPIEAVFNTRPHPSPIEDSGNASTVVVSRTNVPSIEVTASKPGLPAHLKTAVPLEKCFLEIPRYTLTEDSLNYKNSDVLDWKSEPLSLSDFALDRKVEVKRVVCTGPGQGWRLQGHLLVSELQRPPQFAAMWSLYPRVRLRLPTPNKESANTIASTLLFEDKVYQKLSDDPLTYALVLVAIDNVAQCRRLLSRGAPLLLYCLETGLLHDVGVQRLNNGFLLSGASAAEAPLAELTRLLHAPTPVAPKPSSPKPSAPILNALLTAKRRPPGTLPPEPPSKSPLLQALITAVRSPPTLNPKPTTPTSEPRPPTSEPRPPTSEPGPPTSEPRPPTSEPRPPTSEPRPPTSEPGPPTPHAPISTAPDVEPRPQPSASVSTTPENELRYVASSDSELGSVPVHRLRPPGLRPNASRSYARPDSPESPASPPGPRLRASRSYARPDSPDSSPSPPRSRPRTSRSCASSDSLESPPRPKSPMLGPRGATVSVSALLLSIPEKVLPNTSSLPVQEHMHPHWRLSEAAFVARYRLPKARVFALARELLPILKDVQYGKVLYCLTYLSSSDARPLAVAAPVLDALGRRALLRKYVRFPRGRGERGKTISRFKELYKLPNVLGVIDGVHIPLDDIPQHNRDTYLNKAGFHSLNVQLICDADQNILSVDPSQGGSVHDCAIWAAHPLSHELSGLHEGGEAGWLLGDSGYLQRETLMTPFPCPATPPESLYNSLHSQAWSSIKRTVHTLRTRWRRLTTKLPEDRARKIINACAVLHNIAQECHAPTSDVDVTRQTKMDSLLEEHQESAVVSLVTAPDRDRLLREWRTGVVARDALIRDLLAARHAPDICTRRSEAQNTNKK